ncbi:hypothetical protein RRG08_057362 [Elysia crispata]|uniref:Uncharacterized protein n=1 Tax=Elysia crispata TaxID=231223 RepID=A0AAE0YJP4_9GAST|nr:hypothetical protein RRG08_057362 [Elysia crispata]
MSNPNTPVGGVVKPPEKRPVSGGLPPPASYPRPGFFISGATLTPPETLGSLPQYNIRNPRVTSSLQYPKPSGRFIITTPD